MDLIKIGNLIFCLRKEKGWTQKEMAAALFVSDKTVSKWECGQGFPDAAILPRLSEILDVPIEKILTGDLSPNDTDGGNMKKIKFYRCQNCGNTLTGTSEADISCCGRNLDPLCAKPAEGIHDIKVDEIEDEYYITFPHDMSKEHYLTFLSYVAYDRVLLVKLYPEQGSEVRLPKLFGGKFYFHCNQHGLWVK